MADDADATDAQLNGPDHGVAAIADAMLDGETSKGTTNPPASGVRIAMAAGALILATLAGLTGWLGYRVHGSHQNQRQDELYLQAARQAALNLTTISSSEVEADVQRIIDSSTGTFRDDFQKRSPAFINVFKQVPTTTEGTVTGAGLESVAADTAQVVVAVAVKSTVQGAPPEPNPRGWQMRVSLERFGDVTKVSNVEFVP